MLDWRAKQRENSLFTPITWIIPSKYLLFFCFVCLFVIVCDLSGRKYQRKLGSVSEPLRGALFQNEAHVKVECSLDFVQFIEVVYVSVDGYIVMITKQKAFNKSLIDQKTQVVYMDPDDWEVLMQGGHFRSRLDIKKLLPTGNLMSHVHHLPNGNGFWGRAQRGHGCTSTQVLF